MVDPSLPELERGREDRPVTIPKRNALRLQWLILSTEGRIGLPTVSAEAGIYAALSISLHRWGIWYAPVPFGVMDPVCYEGSRFGCPRG